MSKSESLYNSNSFCFLLLPNFGIKLNHIQYFFSSKFFIFPPSETVGTDQICVKKDTLKKVSHLFIYHFNAHYLLVYHSILSFCCFYNIIHKHSYCHWSYSPWNRRYIACFFFYIFIIYISCNFSIF